MRLGVLAPLVLVSLVVAACSAAPAAVEDIGKAASPIINGTNSDATQDAVVLIVYELSADEAFECSGTLLAPNLVLTARHCVSKTTDAGFSCDEKGNGTPGGAVGADFTAASLHIFAGANRPPNPFGAKGDANGSQIFHDNAGNLCNHDLALILLDQPLTGKPIASIRLDSPATTGETFTAVGWGVTTTTDMPSVRQQRTGVKIESVGPMADPGDGLAVGPNEFLVGEAICQGDSGGPAFDTTTGAIVGTVSRGGNGQMPSDTDPSSTCVDGQNFYSMTSGFKDVITAAYAAAGQDPWLESGPNPLLAKIGAPCTSGAVCQSNLCLTDATGAPTTCTQSCMTDACPSGYTCSGAADSRLCTVAAATARPGTTTTTTTCSMGYGARGGSNGSTFAAWGLLGIAALAAKRRRRVS